MNIIVIVGSHPRNLMLLKYLANIKDVNIINVFLFKRERLIPKSPKNLKGNLKKLWKIHFNKRYNAEKKYFLIDKNILKKFPSKYIFKSTKELHSKKIIDFIKNNKAEACFISGVPIIKRKLLKFLPKYTVNLHLGLIPYYKGSITGFWPFFELRPNMLGTTYHVISEKVDTGEIIHQNTPVLKKKFSMHEAICVAVIAALEDLSLVIKYIKFRIKKKIDIKIDSSLITSGNTYKRKDWKPEMLEKIYVKYNDELCKYFLEGKIISKNPKLKKIKLI